MSLDSVSRELKETDENLRLKNTKYNELSQRFENTNNVSLYLQLYMCLYVNSKGSTCTVHVIGQCVYCTCIHYYCIVKGCTFTFTGCVAFV